jgi:hypothetical protein
MISALFILLLCELKEVTEMPKNQFFVRIMMQKLEAKKLA